MFKVSILIRVIFVAGLTYLAGLLLTTGLMAYFHVASDALLFGIPIPWIAASLRVGCAVVAALLANYYFFDRPLMKLTHVIAKAGDGDFLVRAPEEAKNEMGLLAHNFNRMLRRLALLSSQKVESERQLVAASEKLKYRKRLEEKGRLIEKTNKTLENLVRDLSLLYEIGQGINQTVESHELYQVISDVLSRHLSLENFSLMVWDEKLGRLQVKSVFGFEGDPSILEMSFQDGEGIAGAVFKKGETILVEDTTLEPRFAKKGILTFGSMLSVPLNYKGETLGVINFGRNKTYAFGPHDIKMLTLVANQVGLALANANLYTRTRELSVKDELTKVYNRRHFGQVIQLEWKRALRFKRELSLLMLDIDHFKNYNDTCGHLRGDRILREMGELLNLNLREVDTVARFGGEEFVILLPDTDKRGALAVAEKLRHLVQEGLQGITVSIGVASFPDDVREMDDLIDHADIALYEAKDQGRNCVLAYQTRKKQAGLEPHREPQEEINPKPGSIH